MDTMPNADVDDLARWKSHLVAVAEKRDRTAFAALYGYFAPRIKSFFIQQGMADHSEELMQEVFVKVWHKAQSYNPEKAAVSTWIYTIARNLRIDFLRKKRIDEVPEEDAEEPAEESQFQLNVENNQIRESIQAVFKFLNQEQRNVIQKVYFEDKSHEQASRELQMTLGEVKSRVRSSMKVFRARFRGEQL